MGSGGRAIGPDGKPIKNNSSSNINKSGPPAPNGRGVRGGRMVKDRMGGPGPMRGPMHGPGGPMMGGGPMGPRGGPMGGYGGGPGGPMGNRGPMGPGGPGGPNQGMGGGPMGGNGMMAPIRGSGPDPHGNFGFFRDVPINQLPANRLGMMSDDRMGSKQPGGGGSGLTPSAQTVGGGSGPIGGGPNRGMQQQHAPQQQQLKQSGPTPLMSIGVSQQGPAPVSQPAAAHSNSNTSQPAAVPAAQSGGAVPVPGDVPGFGTNSSIHELFGKMVWRKMEGLRDQSVVDRLQNRIMNLIHDALADQNAAPQPASQQPAQQSANNMMMNNGMGAPQQQQRTSGLNFRSF